MLSRSNLRLCLNKSYMKQYSNFIVSAISIYVRLRTYFVKSQVLETPPYRPHKFQYKRLFIFASYLRISILNFIWKVQFFKIFRFYLILNVKKSHHYLWFSNFNQDSNFNCVLGFYFSQKFHGIENTTFHHF